MSKGFIRQDYMRHLKLGKNRKKLQKWRKPKGMHSKMRQKRKGYPKTVSIGYGTPKEGSGKIKGLIPMRINNIAELNKIGKENIAVISARIGARKKIDLIKKAEEMKIKILNLGVK
ncbi:MAG: eL32 family ribosomal protein [Nanoarchaeota archaeon]